MKFYFFVSGLFLLLNYSCSNGELKSESNSKISQLSSQLQKYIDSSSYYYLKAIEDIENGGDIKLTESQYSDKIVHYHQRFRNTFDSITNEYMNKAISEDHYDEIRNSILLDSVVNRSERLKQLGLNINLE